MVKRKGGVLMGSDNPAWKGGRRKMRGYVCIYAPDHPYAVRDKRRSSGSGYVFEHRLAMEKKLGRYLKPKEVVHHIDGNPTNNLPENLHLFKTNLEHMLWHKRLNEIAIYD